MISTLLFWGSLGSIFYAYAGYPLVLRMLCSFQGKPVRKLPSTPRVTLIVSAYNEEKVISRKIENSLALDYPEDLLEIMVVSDASSDRTDEIVRGWEQSGVRLFRVEGRLGKTSCLNRAVPEAKGDIVIFSDANSLYNREAVREIAANFADPDIGCVTGYTRYRASGGLGDTVGLYAQMERATKRLESRVGSCVGADGAIFAIRKELYEPLKSTDINDLVIPLNIVRQGYRTVLEEGAWCCEETAQNSRGEFSRQVRITNRSLRAILGRGDILPFSARKASPPLFPFQLVSHKVTKFLVPLFLAFVLGSNLALARTRAAYRVMIGMQAAFYAFAALEMGMVMRLAERVMSACRTFLVVNAAILKGWATYLKGDDFVTWKAQR